MTLIDCKLNETYRLIVYTNLNISNNYRLKKHKY